MLLSESGLRASSIAQFLTVLLLFIFVLVITYLTTRWIARLQRGQRVGGDNIEILETAKISVDKYIELVRVGDKYLALGVGKNEVSVLAELNEDSLKLEDKDDASLSFLSVLDKVKTFNKSNKNEENM